MIEIRDLHQEFRLYRHHRGAWGAIRNLFTREHQIVKAVDGVSLEVGRGEMVGYLGPNGAGKSTTIKILTGILVPTRGAVRVQGRVPWKERVAHTRHIGVVFGHRTGLWWDLPVIESFDLLRHIYQVPLDRYRQHLARFDELLGLGPLWHTPVRSLSLGQRMRADLAAALLHDPDLLFLDEPTIGLDVVAKDRMRRFIQEVNRQQGTTVILTTHDLGDVEKLCERVIIIDHGRIMFDGALAGLRARFGGGRVLIVDLEEAEAGVDLPGVRLLRRDGNRLHLLVESPATDLADTMAALLRFHRIRDLIVQEQEIEEIVRRIYEGLAPPSWPGGQSGGQSGRQPGGHGATGSATLGKR